MVTAIAETGGKAGDGQVTGPQVVGATQLTSPELPKQLPVNYHTYRVIRKHPTVVLCRLLISSPILAANWSFEKRDDDVPDEWVELVETTLGPIRNTFLDTAIMGMIDFGWQGFEIVWGFNENTQVVVTKLKPLLQDITEILVEVDTGEFVGFRQDATVPKVDVYGDKALLLNIGVEGTNWYGEGRLETTRAAVVAWDEADVGAKKYDAKIAGSHYLIRYPVGKTPYKGGEEWDNYDIATDLGDSLVSSGVIKVPKGKAGFVKANGDEETAWEISIIADPSARQYSYVAREEYLDKLIVRGMGLPERAVLEASLGTRADAGVHTQTAAATFDLMHRGVVNAVNEKAVDATLVMNFGEEARGAVYISPAPITDVSLSFLQEVYRDLLKDPAIRSTEYMDLDMSAMRDKVDVPHDGEPGDDDDIADGTGGPADTTGLGANSSGENGAEV